MNSKNDVVLEGIEVWRSAVSHARCTALQLTTVERNFWRGADNRKGIPKDPLNH